jgi:site-specific DNA recombinase
MNPRLNPRPPLPEEAETVRTIFQLYLDLGSMGALIEDLDRRGIRTKVVPGSMAACAAASASASARWRICSRISSTSARWRHRREVHAGEHEPIIDRDLFEAVQAKLAANAVARKVRLRGSASILAGRILRRRCRADAEESHRGL